MSRAEMRSEAIARCLIGLTLIGMVILIILVFAGPSGIVESPWRRSIIYSAFGSICLLGMMATMSPSIRSRINLYKRGNDRSTPPDAQQVSAADGKKHLVGHHPDCGNFSSHVIRIGDRTYCAGCTGLLVGATIALLGTMFVFLVGPTDLGISIMLFLSGLSGVSFNIMKYELFDVRSGRVNSILNIIYVVGAFLTLVGMEGIKPNVSIQIYYLSLVLYFILVRMLLSQIEHNRMCMSCVSKTCVTSA